MFFKKKNVVAAIVLTLAASCGPAKVEDSDKPMQSNVKAIESAISDVRAQFEQAVAEGNWQTLGGLIAEGAVMVQPGAEDWRVMQELTAGAPFPQGAVIKIQPLELKIINNEWAYEFGASTVTYRPSPDGEEIQLRDTYLLIIRKTDGGWRPYREVASATPPPGGWPN